LNSQKRRWAQEPVRNVWRRGIPRVPPVH
jgi:hypothetical protein